MPIRVAAGKTPPAWAVKGQPEKTTKTRITAMYVFRMIFIPLGEDIEVYREICSHITSFQCQRIRPRMAPVRFKR